jgi:hypothetical protein
MHPKQQKYRNGGKSMTAAGQKPISDEEDEAAPVTILDALGRVLQILPVAEFRRIHGVPERPTADKWRRRRERAKPSEIEEGVTAHPVSR